MTLEHPFYIMKMSFPARRGNENDGSTSTGQPESDGDPARERSFAYLLIKRDDLKSVRIGDTIRVKTADLESIMREKEFKKQDAPAFVRRLIFDGQ